MTNSIYFAIPFMGLLAILQTAVLPRLPILGVVPQLLFLLAMAWGLSRGLEQGLLWGFIAGLWVDLFSLSPLGLTALGYMLAIGVAVLLQAVLPPNRLLVVSGLAMLGTLLYLLVYFVALRLFGFGMSLQVLLEMLPVVLLHGILILPIFVAVQAVLRAIQPRRVEL